MLYRRTCNRQFYQNQNRAHDAEEIGHRNQLSASCFVSHIYFPVPLPHRISYVTEKSLLYIPLCLLAIKSHGIVEKDKKKETLLFLGGGGESLAAFSARNTPKVRKQQQQRHNARSEHSPSLSVSSSSLTTRSAFSPAYSSATTLVL
jgi:hypothetical protein